MRVLHCVEFYKPSVGGSQEVVRQLSERLTARGHDVTVATSAHPDRRDGPVDGVEVVGFDVSGNEVAGLRGEVERYRRFVVEGSFDVVLMYGSQHWATDALLPVLPSISAKKVLAPVGFSKLGNPDYSGYYDRMRERLAQFDALVFHSDTYQDMCFAREVGATNIELIPNAADEREFAQLRRDGAFRAAHGIKPDAPLLLTVGGHTGLKGHAQAIAALRKGRLHGATLAIVGNTPYRGGCLPLCRARQVATRVRRPGRRVLLANPPRPQVLDAYADADLFVFCSMVECSPLVLFESIAAGLPFVSVDAGNAEEIAEWSGGGVIVRSPRRPDGLVDADPLAVATAVSDLMADEPRRRELGAAGRRVWEERFTWESVSRKYEDLYARLAA